MVQLVRHIYKEKINNILSVETFSYDPMILERIRVGLFEENKGFRKQNIRRFENVLGGRSCKYTDCHEISQQIIEIFQQTRDNDKAIFRGEENSVDKIVKHAITFISRIWITHPYNDGNTRLAVCLLLLYLKYWNVGVNDDFFSRYSCLFRESLVRACYSDEQIDADSSFAELFIDMAMEGCYSRDEVYSTFSEMSVKKSV